ncbi:LacI family DNA-binding transcriptional regulator [Marinomonas mediterranea]|jgi:Transcriptional regulators|uniref:Transcriptional regulator, LacI family n=1 Tax=Marinomonas mediterranea (strain ATCC 700492 / JCM 21426 / NBRC 103028 / MMB-1) TaxID=717774 RepID=F2K0J4_MARM1|nr:LacI family DNA-binding transcriptional regulator [Marinomonas mediterranea]ADZ90978.1 transcriptional regulator, LacI family [Marinomonas mediterranea MMB-1]WCN09018.1 substrate-binding domain-containing protein [Marinomonas mediterranea]WCN13052.1 substrate-binding domain-containing protein [Marinomonas mediterranea]WCN17121.1 substrate-binding domain-containing protein [Marinomonas mediterranea MMB-1]
MSIKEIATQLDLSVSTVSRALNDYPDISPRTKRRVLKEAAKQGYKLKGADSAHWVQAKRIITAVLPSQDAQYIDATLSKVLSGTRRILEEQDYILKIVVIDSGRLELSEFERLIKTGDQDGFILLRTKVNDAKVHRLLKLDIPFVCYGRIENNKRFAWLDLDNYAVGRMSVETLNENQRACIGIVSVNERYFFAKERLRGIFELAAEKNLNLTKQDLIEVSFDEEENYLACAELLIRKPTITALICLTSTAAKAAALAVMRLQTVGRKIAIIGCDTPIDELTSSMGITSIQPAPPAQIGEKLATMMVSRIKGVAIEELQETLTPGVVASGFSSPFKSY